MNAEGHGPTLIAEDVHHVLSRLPRDLVALLRTNHDLVLAGGFIRATIAGERPSDIDILGPSKEKLASVAKDLALARKGRFHETKNAFTVLTPGRTPVQFIHRWTYAKPADVVADFDFTVAMAAIWCEEEPAQVDATEVKLCWVSKCHPLYYPDLASRRLRYTAPKRAEDAGGSLLRVRKFIARGYHIEAPSLAAVIARTTQKVRENALTDSEEGYATVITGLLREVDPMRVIDGLELVDEHEVVE